MTTFVHETSTRDQIYNFIESYILSHQGRSPSMREIGNAFGLVKSNVLFHLNHLEKQGKLTILPGARGIRLQGMMVGQVIYGNDIRLKVQMVKDGVAFEGFLYRSEVAS